MDNKEAKLDKGLYKVGIALITESESGTDTYGPVQRLMGSRELSAEPQGDPLRVYADSGLYYSEEVNDGYTITLTLVKILDMMKQSIMGELLDNTSKMMLEYSNSEKPRFVLVAQSLDDSNGNFHIWYNCKIERRPTIARKTKEKTLDPQFEQIVITASARASDSLVKASNTNQTPKEVLDTLFTTVWVPSEPSI